MSNQIDNLLQELRNMKESRPTYNAREVWDGIAERKDWSTLGFTSKEEFEKFLADNPYSNL
jgi:hypothetical protein